MTTTFLFQIQDRHMCHEIFSAFKSVYPDAEFNHIKNTITVEITKDSNPPLMESLYKGIREEYYRWQNMSDTERDHFAQYPQPSAAPVLVQEPRICHGYFETGYTPFIDWLESSSTAVQEENKRDTEVLNWKVSDHFEDYHPQTSPGYLDELSDRWMNATEIDDEEGDEEEEEESYYALDWSRFAD